MRDCCDEPDCCRVEKQGPSQAVAVSKASDHAPKTDLPVTHPLHVGEANVLAGIFSLAPVTATDRPPPLACRNTRLLISLIRV